MLFDTPGLSFTTSVFRYRVKDRFMVVTRLLFVVYLSDNENVHHVRSLNRTDVTTTTPREYM